MKLRSLLTLIFAVFFLGSFAQPTVKTDTRYARGATKAYGRMSVVMNGGTIKERGFCWSSEKKEPTVNDSKSTKTINNNGLIYVMENLTPATMYYARAYVTATTGETYYGDAIKFATIPKGTIGWGYDNGGSAAENNRINNAVKSCVDYWNEYTAIPDLYLNVHYGAQTPTADCSYGGWMRIGPNASYQKTGTVMHEALHAIGVGTTEMWNGSSSPLRKGAGTGEWLGDRANNFLKFWDNNSSSVLNGDGTHLWPYGINGAHEDSGTEILYIANSMLAQAVGEDGLPLTGSRSLCMPHYSFTQEDDVKYYIKNENESCGLTTAFLVETEDHKLKWETMTADKATANDAAAWYITFTPSNQLYQLKNASTGNYITYKTTGTNGIVCEKSSSVNENNSFVFMRSRTDVTSATGSKLTTERGYWIITPQLGNATAPCLSANTNGTTSTAAFSIKNDAKSQRWIFLTSSQAKAMENSGLIAARDAFEKEYKMAMALYNTPHAELAVGADEAFLDALNTASASYENAENVEQVNALTVDVRNAALALLGNVYVTDLNNPFNLTPYLNNPGFASNTNGWTVGAGAAYNYSELEFYVDKTKTVTLAQLVKGMPKGTFTLKMQGFQRPGSNDQVYADYNTGNNKVTVNLEMTMATRQFAIQKVKNIMEERQKSQVHNDDKKLADGTYVPNTMASTRLHFDKGYYENVLTGYTEDSGDLRIFLRGSNNASSSWTICDNFRLYFLGALPLEDIQEKITSVQSPIEATGCKLQTTGIFNLNGQRVNESHKGIVIKNGKKYIMK